MDELRVVVTVWLICFNVQGAASTRCFWVMVVIVC
jgi:hypothetical protein